MVVRLIISCWSLHVSHIGHTAERYQIAGHSALVVQAGTVSTRSRGEHPSFNVLRIQRPHISIARLVWEQAARAFTETAETRYRHTEDGWDKAVTDRASVSAASLRRRCARQPPSASAYDGKPRLRRRASRRPRRLGLFEGQPTISRTSK